MPWIQMLLSCEQSNSSHYEEACLSAGALSITFQDNGENPIFEPPIGTTPLWEKVTLTALFDADCDIDATQQHIRQNLNLPALSIKIEILEDKDWVREWMDSYQPMQFGKRLWICPSWQQPPAPEAINIMLDPGVAFGTGTHPTTALCLQWLDQADIQDKIIIDYGCGSGILALAALMLGAKKVIATDIDPQALEATRENCDRNHIAAERLETYLPEDFEATHGSLQADILLANILAGPLLSLAPTLSKHVKSQGYIALSGLLHSQCNDITACYATEFNITETQQNDEWMRVIGQKL